MLFKANTTITLLFFFMTTLSVLGNNSSKKLRVKNFNKNIYGAANQNWSVATSNSHTQYFANHRGLLEFDGNTWVLNELPRKTTLRSLLVISDSLIYTGGYRELGFWTRDENFNLQYHSLNQKAELYIKNNIEFWDILQNNDEIYFQSLTELLVYKKGTLKPVHLNGFCQTINTIENQLICAIANKGLYKINGDSLSVYYQSDFFNKKQVRFIVSIAKKQILIGTESNGIYLLKDNKLTVWSPSMQGHFKENSVNRCAIDKDGRILIGTVLNGLSVFNKNGNLISKINSSSGLQNNTILDIGIDKFNNYWLALDNGIDFVSDKTNRSVTIEKLNDIGTVYDVALLDSKLYIGTNQGLYLKEKNKPCVIVEGCAGQVWDCSVFGNNLFAGLNNKTYLEYKNNSSSYNNVHGGFDIKKDTKSNNLIQSTYTNLALYKKENNKYFFYKFIDNFFDLIRYIEIDYKGNIWASHMHRGIYKLTLDSLREKVIDKKYFGKNSIFGKDYDLHVFKVENRIVFTTEEQFFTYNELSDSIIPFDFLNNHLEKYKNAHRIISAPKSHYWFITKDKIGLFHFINNGVELIKEYSTDYFKSNQLIDDYENIYPLSEKKAILCLYGGIAYLDASFSDSPEITKHQPKLKEFKTYNNNKEIKENTTNTDTILPIPYAHRNLSFNFSFPHYTYEKLSYKATLTSKNFISKQNKDNFPFNYERLPDGKYEFKVYVEDEWGNKSKNKIIYFEVRKPIYLSNTAILLYFFLFINLLFLYRYLTLKKIKKRKKKELIEKERELIKLRNEKLNTEINHKSKELANSTMSIIKKNELLLQLKTLIQNQKKELGPRYPDKYYQKIAKKIDHNLNHGDDWKIFETNFEKAHEKFLQNLKNKYPKLSSRDLRLCAYLKLELSSKDIAPLMGISYRGIENYRYKLRKIFKLSHSENLVEFIKQI